MTFGAVAALGFDVDGTTVREEDGVTAVEVTVTSSEGEEKRDEELTFEVRSTDGGWRIWGEHGGESKQGIVTAAVQIDESDEGTVTIQVIDTGSADGVYITGGDALEGCNEPLEEAGEPCTLEEPEAFTVITYEGEGPDDADRESVVATYP